MKGKARVRVARLEGGRWREVRDEVAAEAPLEIRLRYRDEVASLGVVLRTPGQDAELAAGLLYTEGLLQDPKEVLAIAPCADGSLPPEAREGVIQVFLRHPLPPPPRRHLALTAACGACGREALPDPGRLGLSPPPPLAVDPDLLLALPERLGEAQRLFRATGGLHAAALFDREGRLVARHLGELSEALLLGYLRVLR